MVRSVFHFYPDVRSSACVAIASIKVDREGGRFSVGLSVDAEAAKRAARLARGRILKHILRDFFTYLAARGSNAQIRLDMSESEVLTALCAGLPENIRFTTPSEETLRPVLTIERDYAAPVYA